MSDAKSLLIVHRSLFSVAHFGEHFAVLVEYIDLFEQTHDYVGRLGADAEPIARAVGLDHQLLRLADGVVVADDLDELAVAWRALVRDDDAIARLLGLSGAP